MIKHSPKLVGLVFAGLMVMGSSVFAHANSSDMEGNYNADATNKDEISILINGTELNSPITGMATFRESAEGLKIIVNVSGVPIGKHGIHIHEKGDCSDHGNAAGGHFNPDGVPHGDLLKDGFAHAHAGDLGNIEIDEKGNGHFEKTLPGLSLYKGKYAVVGRSLMIHEKEDNFGQPTGNAGSRLACAIIS